MKKLIQTSFSIIDYDGPLKNFQRFGQGIQQWGNFCEIEGEWEKNELNGNATIQFKNFPMKGELKLQQNRIIDTSFQFNDWKMDLNFTEEFQIRSGIIEVKEGMLQIHFTVENNKIQNFEVLRNLKDLDLEKFQQQDKIYQFKTTEKSNRFIRIDLNSNKITFVKLNQLKELAGKIEEINVENQTIYLHNYSRNDKQDAQYKLCLSASIPYSVKEYTNQKFQIDKVAYASGLIIKKESDSLNGKLVIPGNNTYIVGKIMNDSLDGDCKIILDGKHEIQGKFQEHQLYVKNLGEFFNKLEDFKDQSLGELEVGKLNGYHKLQFRNKVTYEGYFLNDFVYCHKDALMSSLRGIKNDDFSDLEEFLAKVKRFEGTIVQGKVQGKAKIEYVSGDIFEGKLNNQFMKTGKGTNLQPNGELYAGDFQRDQYHGLGRLFKGKDEFVLGYYENGKMLIQFDLRNMDTNLYEQISNQLAKEIAEMDMNDLEFQSDSKKGIEFKTQSQIQREEEFKEIQRKKKEEEEAILQELNKEVEIVSIFYFRNGYSFHGRLFNDQIVDNSEGDIINREDERIPVKYKYLSDIDSGSFKSLDGSKFYIFKLKEKKLAEISLTDNQPSENQNQREALKKLKERKQEFFAKDSVLDQSEKREEDEQEEEKEQQIKQYMLYLFIKFKFLNKKSLQYLSKHGKQCLHCRQQKIIKNDKQNFEQ